MGTPTSTPDRTRETPGATRERLLDAAAHLFAERGFEGVSVRDIAAAAEVGHAGVNYHFGSKENLYVEVLQTRGPGKDYPYEASRALVERARCAATPAGVVETLREWIRMFLRDVLQARDPVADGLLRQELANPTGASEANSRVIQAIHADVEELIGLARPDLTDPLQLRLAGIGVVSQCVYFLITRPVALQLLGEESFDEDLVERIEAQVLSSCLHGLLGPPR